MKIKTWIKYTESYLPPRCRKLRYRECEEYVQITLAETTMDSLRLAFEDKSYFGRGKIYAYRGKLWTRAKMIDNFGVSAEEQDERGYHTPLDVLVWRNEHGSRYFYRCPDEEAASKKAILKRARSDMRQYLLVDGSLFVRTSEPRYCIYTFGLGGNHGGTCLSVDYRYNSNISRKRYFSALHSEEAVAEANRIAQARGDTLDVGKFRADITVFLPELVKVNPQKQHGDGDPLSRKFDEITMAAPDPLSAGLLCMAVANSAIENHKKPG